MSTIPSSLGRTSTAMGAELLLSNLRRSQAQMLRIQTELTTGQKVNRPSDAAADYSAISTLRTLLSQYDQRMQNLDRASNLVDVTDAALADVSDLILEAQSVASSQIGATSDAETRRSEAAVVESLIDTLRELANRDYEGIHLFAGRTSSTMPFVDALGGLQYVAAADDLEDQLGTSLPFAVNTNGAAALGALSSRIAGSVDLDPAATAATRIADVNGARNLPVLRGAVTVTVNGATTEVDLSDADTLGDVATRINDVLGATGTLAITANGFTLTANAGQTIDIADTGLTGAPGTAADLGIVISAASGTTAGADINPRLTGLTQLSALGVAVDFTGGLKVTNGTTTTVIDFTGATTLQDVINCVSAANCGIRMAIDSEARCLNIINEVSGTKLSVGENAGGTTATDLGIRSFGTATLLADFNDGLGVRNVEGQNDFRIELADGVTTIDVNLDGAATVQDVITAINTAGGGNVTASLAADGNGLVLTDNIGGAGAFRVTALNNSFAAGDLGIAQSVSGATITGEDNATVATDSVFSHLIALRDGLLANDTRRITLAGERITADVNRIAVVRAQAGVRSNRLALQKDITQERKLQTETLLSGLRDTDFAEAISRFQLLQQQLQASMLSGQTLLTTSLLDFLR